MNRYELEHSHLLQAFYGDCSEFVKTLQDEGASYLASKYQELGEGEYSQDQFDLGQLEFEGDYCVIRAFLPAPTEPAQCTLLYFFYTQEGEPLRYVTVEEDPEGGFVALGWDAAGNYNIYGEFRVSAERTFVEKVIGELDAGEVEIDSRFASMHQMLQKAELPFYEEEIPDYQKMFEVIDELTGKTCDMEVLVQSFAKMVPVMKDSSLATGRAKMKAMSKILEEDPATAEKLDNKTRLFFGFSVYVACNVISENDDKKHAFMGLPEFESADYIKYKMEEYWGLDPFMFSWAVQ